MALLAPPRKNASPVGGTPSAADGGLLPESWVDGNGDRRHGFPTPAYLAMKNMPPGGTAMTAEQFLALPFDNTRAEWVGGEISYLPMVSQLHGAIQLLLVAALLKWRETSGVNAAIRMSNQGMRVPDRLREPDVVVMRDRADDRVGTPAVDKVWRGADLVVEIVSPDDPRRDTVRKRREYAAGEVGEYWIVDPRNRTARVPEGRSVTVLVADAGTPGGWRERVFREGETAASEILEGFAVDVTACLAGD